MTKESVPFDESPDKIRLPAKKLFDKYIDAAYIVLSDKNVVAYRWSHGLIDLPSEVQSWFSEVPEGLWLVTRFWVKKYEEVGELE